MKTLVFRGGVNPGDTLEHTPGKDPVRVGEEFTVSDDRALELLTNPAIAPLIQEVEQELSKLSRPQLDKLASDAGFDPGTFATKEAVVAALNDPSLYPVNLNPGGVQ